jgi:16S rRNA processing protein RimM
MLEVGFVLRAHGVRGMLRIRSGGDSLGSVRELLVGGQPYSVVQSQREREDWLIKLAGVDDRNAAEALKGKPVAIADAARPAPADHELYVADLIGCTLVDRDGKELGAVTGSFDSGAHEILEAKSSDGKREFMLPFVDAMIVSVDLEQRRIVCDPPPGLVDPDEAE